MPPKVKITKEDIVNAAVEMVRKNGEKEINARSLAAFLGCSTQPVFSNFASMDDLKRAMLEKALQVFENYMAKETESGKYPPYKSKGMAYIRFAKEEKELFKLLYMRERREESFKKETDMFDRTVETVMDNTFLKEDTARLFHLEMWMYVHGIATMFATGYLDPDWELVSQMLTDSYLGLKKQFGV